MDRPQNFSIATAYLVVVLVMMVAVAAGTWAASVGPNGPFSQLSSVFQAISEPLSNSGSPPTYQASPTPPPTITPTPLPAQRYQAPVVTAVPTIDPLFKVSQVVVQSRLAASNGCNHTYEFSAAISATSSGTVTYRWKRSDSAQGPIKSVKFAKGGIYMVYDDWTLTVPGEYSGWEQVEIISPNQVESALAAFTKPHC